MRQAGDSETEAELDDAMSQLRAVSTMLSMESDKYLAKKGVRRRRRVVDVPEESSFGAYIEQAKEAAGVGSPEAATDSEIAPDAQ